PPPPAERRTMAVRRGSAPRTTDCRTSTQSPTVTVTPGGTVARSAPDGPSTVQAPRSTRATRAGSAGPWSWMAVASVADHPSSQPRSARSDEGDAKGAADDNVGSSGRGAHGRPVGQIRPGEQAGAGRDGDAAGGGRTPCQPCRATSSRARRRVVESTVRSPPEPRKRFIPCRVLDRGFSCRSFRLMRRILARLPVHGLTLVVFAVLLGGSITASAFAR